VNVDDLVEAVATVIAPSAFRLIERGKLRPRGPGWTTGRYRYAERELARERAREKARAIIEMMR